MVRHQESGMSRNGVAGCVWLFVMASGCTGPDADPPMWFDTEVVAEAWWGLELGVGGRSLVHVAPDGRAVFGSPDGRVFIEPSPGEAPIAHGPFEGLEERVLTPAVSGDFVLMRNVTGDLLSIDTSDDTVLWQSVDHMPVIATDASGPVAVMRRNTVDPGTRARDLETGDVLWTIEEDADVFDPQAASGGRVCGISGPRVVVVDAVSGDVDWTTEHGLGELSETSEFEPRCIMHGQGILVFGETPAGGDRAFVLFDADGAEVARTTWPLTPLPVDIVPRADGRIVAWSESAMIVFDDQLQEEERFGDRVPAAVDPVSGNMYLFTDGGMVLTNSDFEPIWAGGLGRPDLAYREIGAVVVGDLVYAADAQDGVLGQDRWTRYVALGPPR